MKDKDEESTSWDNEQRTASYAGQTLQKDSILKIVSVREVACMSELVTQRGAP
jgi:hypothetical protein